MGLLVTIQTIAIKVHKNTKLLALYCALGCVEDNDCQGLVSSQLHWWLVCCVLFSLQAIDSRDSMAMALYSQCFAWVIKKINSRIKSKEDFKSIGILDIFGFENFEVDFKNLFRWIVWYWCFIVLHSFVIFTGTY